MIYVAFLRGINVGGRFVKMDQLRSLFSEMGLKSVRSYIQTGNLFFESKISDTHKLSAKIESSLQKKLGYSVPAFVYSVADLEAIVEQSHLDKLKVTDDTRHMLIFISKDLPKGIKLPLKSTKGDMEIIGITKGALFVVIHLINGKFLSSNFLEKTFNINTTGRFYHTTLKILAAAKEG